MIRAYIKWVVFISFSTVYYNCSGPVKKGFVNEKTDDISTKLIGSSKLIKTQNSSESDNINCSLEDRNGNLWFGTTGEGVYWFDGQTFRQYTKSDGLISNLVFCLFESKDGLIWIGTDHGVSVYDGQKFKDVYIASPVHSVHNKLYVFSIMEDSHGQLWFATVEGVYVYDGTSFELFIVNNEGKGYISEKHNTEYMLQDSEGNIWFGSRVNDGVFRYDGKSIVNFKLEELDGHKWAWPALQDKNGDIWFSNWGGTYRYEGNIFWALLIIFLPGKITSC